MTKQGGFLGQLLLCFLAWVFVFLLVTAAGASEDPEKVQASPPVAAETPPEPTWYAMGLGRVAGAPAVAHFWSKGPKFRAETVIFGRPVLTLVDEEYYTTIDVMADKGMSIQRSPLSVQQDAARVRPFAVEWAELVEAGGEKVRTEKSDIGETDVWRLTNVSGRQTVWVSTGKPALPLRVETFDRESSMTSRMDYVNWQYGLAIPDSFFRAGSNVRIRRMDYPHYIEAAKKGPVGPAPPLYRHLLHGRRKPGK